MEKAFNLNYNIRVKLTDKGYQHLANNHNKYCGRITNWERRDGSYYKKQADSEGYTKFQAWCFIEEFGSVTNLGFHGYHNNTILIDENDLKPL